AQADGLGEDRRREPAALFDHRAMRPRHDAAERASADGEETEEQLAELARWGDVHFFLHNTAYAHPARPRAFSRSAMRASTARRIFRGREGAHPLARAVAGESAARSDEPRLGKTGSDRARRAPVLRTAALRHRAG